MNRGSGAGLLGLGIVLVIVGAILEFAVTATAKGFSVHTVGMILLAVGVVRLVEAISLRWPRTFAEGPRSARGRG